MKIEFTAEYEQFLLDEAEPGAVVFKINGQRLLSINAFSRPGAEPGAEDNVIMEVIETMLERVCLQDRADHERLDVIYRHRR
jgi:hypothetical protein